jgi:hypothetical protein
MPMEWRLHVLEARIEERFGITANVTEHPYDVLEAELVSELLAELGSRGQDFPLVLVGDRVACADGIDVEAVLDFIAAGPIADTEDGR